MSEQFKPLAEQVSERMVSLLNDNRSIFTKPMKEDGTSQFVMPINARSKQKYTGAAALVLLMQNRRDPRWLSYDKAAYNKTPVKKGAHGTLIEFHSTNELRPKTENGEPALNKDGKQKMERVKIDEPVLTQAWLYNGKDLMNLKELKLKPHEHTPMERAQIILDNSGVKLNMPGKDTYQQPELYYAVALHHLAHEIAKTQLPAGNDLVREELRTNIASIMLSAELNLPYDLSHHENYLKDWATLLQNEPNELFNAAADAQQIASFVMKLEKPREIRQETKFAEGMEIPYRDTTFKVLQEQAKGAFKIEDMNTGDKIRIKPSDGLYKSLMSQLTGQREDLRQDQEQEMEEEPELAEAEEETRTTSRKR